MGDDERDVLFFKEYYGRSEEIRLIDQIGEEKWKAGIFAITFIVCTAFIIYNICSGNMEINYINLLCLFFCDMLFVANTIVAIYRARYYSKRLKEL